LIWKRIIFFALALVIFLEHAHSADLLQNLEQVDAVLTISAYDFFAANVSNFLREDLFSQ